MKNLFIVLVGIALLFLSCKREKAEQPKVIYENTKAAAKASDDTTQIQIADLPVLIPGTDILLHPIGNYRVEGKRKAGYGYEKGSFIISNFSEFELTGYLQNIKFQKVGSDSITPLTDKPVVIQSATYLKLLADKNKVQVMVYVLADMDTNKDGKLDAGDINTIYISEGNGSRFVKLSPDLQEFVDWNLVEAQNRLYFRTIEDTNKSGDFDKDDVLHYRFVDLTGADWEVESYSPVN